VQYRTAHFASRLIYEQTLNKSLGAIGSRLAKSDISLPPDVYHASQIAAPIEEITSARNI